MSSKTNKVAGASSSSEQQKREHDAPSTCKTSLTPKLRFPEFRDAAGWEESRLADICSKITQGGTPDTSEPKFWGGSINWMTPAEMGKTESPFIDATTRTITESGLDNCSSYLLPIYSVILSVRAPIGSLAINTTPMAINQGCKGLITGNTLSFSFLYYSLINSKARLIDLGAGNTFKELSGSALKSYEIGLPSPPEQQKIAACLSSVDEVIAAQAQKLEALKTHKKGLMQQLFPREGETQPRLRFPEFQDAPEWGEKKLSSMVQLVSGTHLSPDQYGKEKGVPYFTGPSDFTNDIQSITKRTNESSGIAKENDTLITVKGSGVGTIWYLTLFSIAMGRQLMAIRATDGVSRFVYQFLLTKKSRFGDLASGNLIPGLSRGDILDLDAPITSTPEQQRVADCLTSLDNLISAQAQKLEALKTHKKGLMQQLFPSPEEEV